MVTVTRCQVDALMKITGEGMMCCFNALKLNEACHEKALEFIRRSGRLVSIKRREQVMTNRERFEAAWRKKYAFEMKRGEGRNGYGLKMHEGLYISDKAQFAYEIWMMAITEG